MSWDENRCPTVKHAPAIQKECEMDTRSGGGTLRLTTVKNAQTYLIAVDGKQGASGNFRLTVNFGTYRWDGRILLQIAISLVILGLLIQDADTENLFTALKQSDLRWLLGHLLLKRSPFSFMNIDCGWHSTRLDRILPKPQIGFASGAINLVFPVEQAISPIALKRLCSLRAGVAAIRCGNGILFWGSCVWSIHAWNASAPRHRMERLSWERTCIPKHFNG